MNVKIKIIKNEESGLYTAYSDNITVVVTGKDVFEAINKFKEASMLWTLTRFMSQECEKKGIEIPNFNE